MFYWNTLGNWEISHNINSRIVYVHSKLLVKYIFWRTRVSRNLFENIVTIIQGKPEKNNKERVKDIFKWHNEQFCEHSNGPCKRCNIFVKFTSKNYTKYSIKDITKRNHFSFGSCFPGNDWMYQLWVRKGMI